MKQLLVGSIAFNNKKKHYLNGMNDYKALKNLFSRQSTLNDISGILSWDMATFMPVESRSQRVSQMKILNEYKQQIFKEIKKHEFFKKIDKQTLSLNDSINLDLMKKKYDYYETIPLELIQKKSLLSIECEGLWRKAREKSDFKIVKDVFSKLVKCVKEESELLSQKKGKSKYDCLINKYDRSLDTKKINKLFDDVEIFIRQNINKIIKVQPENKFNFNDKLSESQQFELSKFFMKKLGFNFKKGRVDKSLHPFCGGATDDIRITTRFSDSESFSCFDALMHETGHALYEQGLPKNWLHQPIGQAGGMSLHESQSLFIEMQIIKSLSVSKYLEKIIVKKFSKNKSIWSYDNIFCHRNFVKPGFIRVDADEVHYPLHIIHRFRLELKIIEENINVEEIPELWNHQFKNLLGLDVKNDNDGCLQDIHWFGGDFGYFPTYSIGALIASQIKYKIKQEIVDFEELIENGEFKRIISWIKNKIHISGNSKKIDNLLKETTGNILSTKHFKKHIKDRYLKRTQ